MKKEIKWLIQTITLYPFDSCVWTNWGTLGIPLNDVIKFKVNDNPYKSFGILGKPLHRHIAVCADSIYSKDYMKRNSLNRIV